MTTSEFKAWFDGFSQGVSDSPTKEQWEMIKKKMDEVSEETPYQVPNLTRLSPPLEFNPNHKSILNPPYTVTCKTNDSSTHCVSAWN